MCCSGGQQAASQEWLPWPTWRGLWALAGLRGWEGFRDTLQLQEGGGRPGQNVGGSWPEKPRGMR